MSETNQVDRRITTGTKFFRYIEDKEDPEIIRILNVDEFGNVKYFDSDNHKHDMKYKDLIDNYKMLKADGAIAFSIVNVSQDINDVVIALQTFNEKPNVDKNLPYCVCRQSIFDFFTNMAKPMESTGIQPVGISVSQETCPADINFADILACSELLHNTLVSIYLDDGLSDILRFVKAKKYNDTLRKLKQDSTTIRVCEGYCESLKDLMVSNNFMYDFRRCFNIMELPFAIDEESEELSNDNILYMEHELKVNIMETYLIRYTKEIDLSTIKRDYKLVTSMTDRDDKVYIVGYDTSDGPYVAR